MGQARVGEAGGGSFGRVGSSSWGGRNNVFYDKTFFLAAKGCNVGLCLSWK